MFDFRFNTPTPFPESWSSKRFHASGMRGIDFSHKITPKNVFFTKIFKKKFFSENGLRLSPPPFKVKKFFMIKNCLQTHIWTIRIRMLKNLQILDYENPVSHLNASIK